MAEFDTERTKRLFEGLLTYGSLPFWGIVIFYAYSQLMPRAKYGVVFLGGILLLFIVNEFVDVIENEDWVAAILLSLSVVVVVATTAYLFLNFHTLYAERRGFALRHEYIIAFLFTLVMIYMTWRAFGVTFLLVVLAGIGYALFGQYLPGILGHNGISETRILRLLVIEIEGFYGFLNRLVAAWIALFLLYAGLLKSYGAFDLIFRIAVRSAKYVDSGVAQTAVIASAIIGSVNGSQTANAGMTGSFTIPMMKENGVKPETAGGIEAVASTAGQVLPPVMGAAAFIMGSLIIGITYVDVIVAGLIPAAILVISIAIAVHYAAAPQIEEPNLDEYFDDEKTHGELALDGIKYGLPLVVLIYILGVLQWTVMTAALYTSVSMLAMGIGIPLLSAAADSRRDRTVSGEFVTVLKQTRDGAREGAIVLAPVAIILAAINGVVDLLMATGVPTAISLALMDLSGGVMIIAVLLAMVICILLGLGMPTTASYTVVALLIAPTLVHQFFVPDLAAHFFVFYAAILAGLTPPIATCVAVACGIAGADFWRTCLESIKISAPLFVLPFVFIYHPAIVSGTFNTTTLASGAITLLGAIAIIHGMNYRFALRRTETLLVRAAFFVLGVTVMVFPGSMIRLGALALVTGMYLTQASVGQPAPIQKLRSFVAGMNGSGQEPKRKRPP